MFGEKVNLFSMRQLTKCQVGFESHPVWAQVRSVLRRPEGQMDVQQKSLALCKCTEEAKEQECIKAGIFSLYKPLPHRRHFLFEQVSLLAAPVSSITRVPIVVTSLLRVL